MELLIYVMPIALIFVLTVGWSEGNASGTKKTYQTLIHQVLTRRWVGHLIGPTADQRDMFVRLEVQLIALACGKYEVVVAGPYGIKYRSRVFDCKPPAVEHEQQIVCKLAEWANRQPPRVVETVSVTKIGQQPSD